MNKCLYRAVDHKSIKCVCACFAIAPHRYAECLVYGHEKIVKMKNTSDKNVTKRINVLMEPLFGGFIAGDRLCVCDLRQFTSVVGITHSDIQQIKRFDYGKSFMKLPGMRIKDGLI